MQEKLRELIARMRQEGETQETTGFPNSAKIARWCADELEAALAASEPAPQPLMGYCDRHRWLHEKDRGPSLPPFNFPCENWAAALDKKQ